VDSIAPIRPRSTMRFGAKNLLHDYELSTVREPKDGEVLPHELSTSEDEDIEELLTLPAQRRKTSLAIRGGRDGGGSNSGMPSPNLDAERDEYFEDVTATQPSNGRQQLFRTETGHSQLESLPEDPDVVEKEQKRTGRVYTKSFPVDQIEADGSKETKPAADGDALEPGEGTAEGDIY